MQTRHDPLKKTLKNICARCKYEEACQNACVYQKQFSSGEYINIEKTAPYSSVEGAPQIPLKSTKKTGGAPASATAFHLLSDPTYARLDFFCSFCNKMRVGLLVNDAHRDTKNDVYSYQIYCTFPTCARATWSKDATFDGQDEMGANFIGGE